MTENKSREYIIVDHQVMPVDVSLHDFLYNIASQSPAHLMIREGDVVTLKIELLPKSP